MLVKENLVHDTIWNVSKYLLFVSMVFVLPGCNPLVGTSPIKAYDFTTCKYTLDSVVHTLDNNSTIRIFDSTDKSGMNRPGFFDIIISTNGTTNIYKMFYVGSSDYWTTHKENCTMSIYEINNKSEHDFRPFSSEKRKAIQELERHIISKLKHVSSCTK